MLPHAALILTSLLKDDVTFDILDANISNLSEHDCMIELGELQPHVVFVSAMSNEYHGQYHTAMALAKKVCPKAITVMGGVYPTVLGEKVLKDRNVDYIFLGHAEERVNEFLRLLLCRENDSLENFSGIGWVEQGTTRINPVETYISDVAKHVQMDYSKIDLPAYLSQNGEHYQFNSKNGRGASIITSYGCSYNCIFCATRAISGRKVAFRPSK